MDYSTKTNDELKALCKERKIKGVSKCKNKGDLIKLIQSNENVITHVSSDLPVEVQAEVSVVPLRQ